MEMSDFVKIVRLLPMRVVSFHAMGEFLGSPEEKASAKMVAWAKPRGMLNDPAKHMIFGFNNPDPPLDSEGIPEPNKKYGYEFWITVGDQFEKEDDADIKTVEGGLYAVMTCKVEGAVDIGKTWGRLFKWIKESESYDFHPNWKGLKSHHSTDHFEHGTTGLENHLNPWIETPPKGKPWKPKEKLIIDMYAPIIEK
jgi:DNA gyrase inhibitor GyrI